MYFRYGIPRAIRSFRHNWRSSVNNVLILTATLSILGMITLLYLNVMHFSSIWLSNTSVSLFLKPDLSEQGRQNILDRVGNHPLVKEVRLVSPEEGMKDLAEKLGANHAMLAGVGENELPFTIDFDVFVDYRNRVDEISDDFKKLPGVSEVVYTERMLKKVELFFRVTTGIGLFFLGMIIVAFYLVLSHATKLSLHARREEIVILNLVGATRGFVRSSFVVEGVMTALAGCGLSLLVVWICNKLLLFGLSIGQTDLDFAKEAVFYPLEGIAGAVIAAVILGAMGSRLAVNRTLREMDP